MRVEIQDRFSRKLAKQVAYIAADKPDAARKFRLDLRQKIRSLAKHPYSNRKSIFADDETIRDMIFKGYVIVYKVDAAKHVIRVFGFTKYQNELKD